MAIYTRIYEENPNERQIKKVVDCLQSGGIVILPTDTVYGICCDIYNAKAFDRLCQLTGKKKEKSNFSFICYDISNLSDFARPIDNAIFKLMKRVLPGPYTFVLEANNKVPKCVQKKKTVGIRVPANNIPCDIVKMLGNPIMNASLKVEDDMVEYLTDPELICDLYKDKVDMIVDGGFGDNTPSTVISCLNDEIELIRQGKGLVDFI